MLPARKVKNLTWLKVDIFNKIPLFILLQHQIYKHLNEI